jgi:drug/metabolite transporter (DMT)-like permease
MHFAGALICLASAVAFGAMAILGKLAYDEGATVGTLLAVRFLLAAALFWILVAGTGAARHLRTLGRRDLGIALALGGVGYSAQAGAYFAALQRLDASLLSLVLYTFPAMVMVARSRAGEPPHRRRARARLGRPVPRPGRGGRGSARPAGNGSGGRGCGGLQHLRPHLGRNRRARRAT